MIRLGRILKENIDQHKRKVYLKAAIEMATAYSRRGYTQDEAIKDAAQGIKNVHGYVLTPQDIEAVKHFVPVNPQFKEITVKPVIPYKYKVGDRIKQALSDEEPGVVVDRVENFEKVEKDPKGVDIGWVYHDEDQVTKPWYFIEYDDKRNFKAIGISPFSWEPEDELEFNTDKLKEITVKPTDRSAKFKQAVVDAMYEDYINNFDGEFEDWVEYCLDYIPGKVLLALDALEEVIGIDETDDFFNDEAFERVRGMVEDESLEEIIVKPTVGFSSRKYLKFTLDLCRGFMVEDAQLEIGNVFNAAKDYYNSTIDENQEMADADGEEPNFDHIELIEHAEGYYDVRVGEESAVVFIGSNYEESPEIYDAYLEYMQDPNSSKIDDLLSNTDFSMNNVLYSDGERAPSGNLEEITVKPTKQQYYYCILDGAEENIIGFKDVKDRGDFEEHVRVAAKQSPDFGYAFDWFYENEPSFADTYPSEDWEDAIEEPDQIMTFDQWAKNVSEEYGNIDDFGDLEEITVKPSTNTFRKDWNAWLDMVIKYLIELKYSNHHYFNGGMIDYIQSFAQWWDDDETIFNDDDLELFENEWEKLINLATKNKWQLNTLNDYIEFFEKAKKL